MAIHNRTNNKLKALDNVIIPNDGLHQSPSLNNQKKAKILMLYTILQNTVSPTGKKIPEHCEKYVLSCRIFS